MKYALVKDSVVTNMVEWDGSSEISLDGSLVAADSNAYIGGGYDGSSFAAQPAPEPVAPTAEEQAVSDNRDSAKTKLEGLGLTADELKDSFRLV